MKRRLLTIALCLAAVAGCTPKSDIYINFEDYNADDFIFKPVSKCVTDLSAGLPDNTTMPDGTSVNEFVKETLSDTKANCTTVGNFLQGFLQWEERNKVIEISGIYRSTDDYGSPATLSGKIVIPADKPIKRVILVSHYTIGSNAEAPSNCFPLEGQLAQLGYAVVCSDYLGYGVTNDRYHPYLLMEVCAHNVIDMYLAVRPFLKAINREPIHDDIYLMGYSQGGATTMAVEYMIERDYGPESDNPIKINRVFAGGGIYDIKATFESYIETNHAGYPCGVPFVIVGQVKGNHIDNTLITRLIRPEVTKYTEDWFLKKTTATGQMNEIIGTKKTDEILQEVAFDRTSDEITKLYQVMTLNSVLSLAWTPQAPVYMLHSIDDDTVPYENAARARVRWDSANIQYNFGHYGNHMLTCLRFIYTVKSIIENEE